MERSEKFAEGFFYKYKLKVDTRNNNFFAMWEVKPIL